MKKCGLRKAYALGGELGEMTPTELAQFTNNPEILNAASTRKWMRDEAAQQAKYPPNTMATPVTADALARADRGLAAALQDRGFGDKLPQPIQQPQAQQLRANPFETSFQQDIDARQRRISGYRKQLGYAQGGTVDAEALMREMAAKYGTTGAQQAAAQAPAPAPRPAPAPAPQPKPSMLDGLRRLATGNLEGRMKAAGFNQGGTVDGKGYIHGEKGVDKVPAKIAETGEDILVSEGERIVNKKQNAALERLAAEAGLTLDEYLERSTGEPVGPQMKQGLRAAEQGWEVDPAGTARRPGQVSGALPNPNAGGPVAVRNNSAWTSGGGFKADPGAIDVEFTQVRPNVATQALPAPVTPPVPPRSDLPYRAGQVVGKGADWLKNNKGAAAGVAGEALTIYNAHQLASSHDDFYNSPDVPTIDKGFQMGRDVLKIAVPYALGAIGTGAGTVASPTVIVNPVTGGIAGYALGSAAVSGIDDEGEALKEFRARTRANTDAGGDIGNEPTTPPIDADTQEVMRETAMAGLGSRQGLQKAKSMDYLQNMGVDTSKMFAPRDDVNMVNANGPERVRGGAVTTINTQNGPIYAGRDGKGQLVVTSGLDRSDAEQAATTKSGYEQAVAQAQKDKDSLARIQRERAEFDAFDPSITDPAVREAGLRKAAMGMAKDEAAAKALQHKEDRDATLGLQRDTLGLRRDMLNEQKRQFDLTANASIEAGRRAAQKEGIKEFDELVKSAGYEGDEATKFADWFRGNYAGRRHLIDGKEVDVKGFEDMSPDEKRAHMTNAKAMYEWVKKANANEVKGRTSMAVPNRLQERGLTFDDANKGPLLGVPDVFYSDNDKRHSLAEIAARRMLPEYFGSDRMIDELDDKGDVLRSWSKPSLRGEAGPWGSQDVDVFLKDRMQK